MAPGFQLYHLLSYQVNPVQSVYLRKSFLLSDLPHFRKRWYKSNIKEAINQKILKIIEKREESENQNTENQEEEMETEE